MKITTSANKCDSTKLDLSVTGLTNEEYDSLRILLFTIFKYGKFDSVNLAELTITPEVIDVFIKQHNSITS